MRDRALLSLASDLKQSLGSEVGAGYSLQTNLPPGGLTTFGLGARVPLVIDVESVGALTVLLRELSSLGTPWRFLGNGSNVVLPDIPLEYPVIRYQRSFSEWGILQDSSDLLEVMIADRGLNRDLSGLSLKSGEEVSIYAQAGMSLMGLSRTTSRAGLSGLEFGAGIPASIGGAVFMNAGAHGAQVSSVLEKVVLMCADGELQVRLPSEMSLGYRSSGLKAAEIVVGAVFRLTVSDTKDVLLCRSKALAYRQQTQPLKLASAGSVFRNPDMTFEEGKLSAGALIEKVGLKGRRCGGVEYSQLHANWLVRVAEEARTDDARELIKLARQAVQREFGVDLMLEQIYW